MAGRSSQQPASAAELAKILPQQDRLLPYWQSPELIAITGTALQPGEQTKAGIDVKSGNDIDLNAASTATMTEASPEALQRMLPKLVKGSAPQNNTQIVISRTLADNLGASLGSTVTFVAPPFDGWMSLDGRIGEAVADTQRAWTVSGLTDESKPRHGAWKAGCQPYWNLMASAWMAIIWWSVQSRSRGRTPAA